MAKYIEGENRNQMVLIPETLDDLIPMDSEARIIDYFVDSLDLEEMGFERARPNAKGTNSYNPRDLLKLYIYGYRNKIRSSRQLEKLCRINVEVMWMLKKITPDFRTISDFRKNNIEPLKKVFQETVKLSNELKLLGNTFSEDGYKITAVNSKDRNYTLSKLDDRIKREEKQLVSEVSKNMAKIYKNLDKEALAKKALEEVERYLSEMDEEEKEKQNKKQ